MKRLNKWSYISLTLVVTWILQFMPILLKMDVTNASVSSFDYASIFFTIGGMMPTVIGLIFVFLTYSKAQKIDFFKRCFVPTKRSILCILGALLFICLEVGVTQFLSVVLFDAKELGFEGIKIIISKPYMFFYFLFWGLISGPMSEEFGWRGYLQDQLLDKEHMLRNTLLIGLVWGIWHLPLFFYPAQAQYEWFQTSPLLGVGFIINCMTNALIYNIFYVISKRSVFTILFVHMFENIILTGAMIYPFSEEYLNFVIPATIVMDIIFYFIMSKTCIYKKSVNEICKE